MSKDIYQQKSYLGYGLGLRTPHYQEILDTKPEIDWFEVLTENYMVPGGKPLYYLQQIREHYPLVMHGVSMSLGSTDPLDFNYLTELKKLIHTVNPAWISDHLCWTGVHGRNLHDLMPLPYTEETVDHVVNRILQVQDILQQRILIENVSSYLNFKQSSLAEWEFITAVAERADCWILLDVNNIYVSSQNHEFDPLDYLYNIPPKRVLQCHLAGHTNHGNHIIDTHDQPIVSAVWDLYTKAVKHLGPVSVMIERDDNIPPLSELIAELNKAKRITEQVLHEQVSCV